MKQVMTAMLVLILASLACDFGATGQVRGSGNIVEQTYDVKGFDQVELDTIGEVSIEQGDTESLTIETDDNILPLLDPQVENGRLILREEGNGHNYKPSRTVSYTVTVKDLTAVTTKSSGDIIVGAVETNKFSVMVNGSGNVTVQAVKASQISIVSDASGFVKIGSVDAKTVEITTRASGTVELTGKTTSLTIKTSGSGDVSAGDMQSTKGEVDIQGSSDVTVWVTDALDITINGSGNASYYDTPALIQNISGSGKIKSLGKK